MMPRKGRARCQCSRPNRPANPVPSRIKPTSRRFSKSWARVAVRCSWARMSPVGEATGSSLPRDSKKSSSASSICRTRSGPSACSVRAVRRSAASFWPACMAALQRRRRGGDSVARPALMSAMAAFRAVASPLRKVASRARQNCPRRVSCCCRPATSGR